MYSDTLTWQDYFEQNAVESLKQNKALMAEAKAAGFTSKPPLQPQVYLIRNMYVPSTEAMQPWVVSKNM